MYEKTITNQLDLLGMSHKIKGYNYCRFAVDFLLQENDFISVERIYQNVSVFYKTNDLCVERNIRYAIEKTWEQGNINQIDNMFGLTVDSQKGRPTNMEFLYMLADKVRRISS